MAQHTTKRSIRNPQLWIGRYVRHMANWWDFVCVDGYTVCEWTGKLMRLDDEANCLDYFNSTEEAEAAGYDECYSYCDEGLRQMADRAKAKAV